MIVLWLATGLLGPASDGPVPPPPDSTLGGAPGPAWTHSPRLVEPTRPRDRFSRVEFVPAVRAPVALAPMAMPGWLALRETIDAEMASAQARYDALQQQQAEQYAADQRAFSLLLELEFAAVEALRLEREAMLEAEAAEVFMAWVMEN